VDANFHLLPECFSVWTCGREIVLTPTQFRLLAVLASEPGRVFSCAELVQRTLSTTVAERTVDGHISELRRKLRPQDWRVQAVPGLGYRFLDEPAG
jgi:DNA-binding response OmpR family regulator